MKQRKQLLKLQLITSETMMHFVYIQLFVLLTSFSQFLAENLIRINKGSIWFLGIHILQSEVPEELISEKCDLWVEEQGRRIHGERKKQIHNPESHRWQLQWRFSIPETIGCSCLSDRPFQERKSPRRQRTTRHRFFTQLSISNCSAEHSKYTME